MPLTDDELKNARVARREVAQFDQRGKVWFAYGALLLNFGLQLIDQHFLWFRVLATGMLVLVVGFGVHRWLDDRRLKDRYASNVELLRVLRERAPHLDDSIGDPFAYKPLFDALNRRLQRRALLWRLDHFLSGKGWQTGNMQR